MLQCGHNEGAETVSTQVSVHDGWDRMYHMWCRWEWWLVALPFAIAIVMYDEMRRSFIRLWPTGWVSRATYY